MAASLVFLFAALAQNSDASRFNPGTVGLHATPAFVPATIGLQARVPMRVPAVATMSMQGPLSGFYPTAPSYNRVGGLTRPAVPMTRNQLRTVRMAARMAADADDAEALRARRFIVGGNWKANGTPESVKQLVKDLNEGKIEIDTSKDMEVVLAPPMVYLSEVQKALRPDFAVAAQNMWDRAPGAWTGETPAEMLSSLGVEWVVLGHSERRENNGETNEVVAAKTKFAIDAGLRPITCIGEKLEARESGETFHVLEEQMKPLADVLTEEDWGKVVLAYEPVWAIGTGLTATPEQAEETHAFLRQWLKDNVSPAVSNSVRIQYGGSVSDENSAELSAKPNIDGFLVGGASLVGDKFTSILNSVHESNFVQSADDENLWQDYGTEQPEDTDLSCYQEEICAEDECSEHWICAEDAKLTEGVDTNDSY